MNKEVQYEYIINNCIETCNYIGEFKTEREKIWLVLAEFLNYSRTKNLNKIRNLGEEIGEWLRGLPSCCTVDFVDYNIVQIGKSGDSVETKLKQPILLRTGGVSVVSVL